MPIVTVITPTVAGSPATSRAKVSDLVSRIQTLVDDPSGSWADYHYLGGFIQQANEDLNTELAAYNLSYNEQVVVLSGVPANTSDLSAYMVEGGLLQNIEMPTAIEWRNVGETDEQWKRVPRADKVRDAVSAQTIQSWEWRAENIYISPSINAVDLRVRFDAITTELDDPTQEVIRGALNVLAWKAAEYASAIRGGLAGTGEPLAKYCERKAMIAADNFESLCVKRMQSVSRRFGRAQQGRRNSLMPPTVG